jgi:putative ATPase
VTDDLFTSAGDEIAAGRAPLAVRMRPASLDEVVGQDHLLAAGSPLRRLVDGTGDSTPVSLLLWGPPGTGKTTLAYLVAKATERSFVELSAVNAGVKDVRAIIDDASVAAGGRLCSSSTRCIGSPRLSRTPCCRRWRTGG